MARVEDTPENEKLCMPYCGKCPSYPKGSKEWLYCARGPSKQPIGKKGCNCPECPVWVNAGLTGMYYCVRSQ